MMFSFLGSTVTNPILAPFVNGFALTVWSEWRLQQGAERSGGRGVAHAGPS